MIRIRHNLNKVNDSIAMVQTDIESIIISAATESRDSLRQELSSFFGGGYDDISVDFQYDNNSYKIIVEGYNVYQMNNFNSISEEDLINFIENYYNEKIKEYLKRYGY